MIRIGVLAVQGAFAEHMEVLKRLGADGVEIRKKSDLIDRTLDGIILPGGESTAMGKLLTELDMLCSLKRMIEKGLPVFGTCAGLILLAKNIVNEPTLHIAAMDISVRRNAYGRQLGSFTTHAEFQGIGEIPMTFIRAPYIESAATESGVEILAAVDNHIVAARQGTMLVTSFHPELTGDIRVHQYFLESMLPS